MTWPMADDVFGVGGAVGVADDAGAGVSGDAVLVDDPLEGAAVAEAVLVNVGRNAAEGEEVIASGSRPLSHGKQFRGATTPRGGQTDRVRNSGMSRIRVAVSFAFSKPLIVSRRRVRSSPTPPADSQSLVRSKLRHRERSH